MLHWEPKFGRADETPDLYRFSNVNDKVYFCEFDDIQLLGRNAGAGCSD